ncbi:hypothetical protein SAMN05421858_1473 [Haladaptatus litoreus]|uniref:Uncharacterized protein n=1 Tax=Haladaptatus litoreus TaxID=553468 RepID=A0A1N6Y9T1_9EURY|nr:hypothetical protein [Haladaptatus litoreus]SIR11330.1 hypothetical protein SAMN05421858_1473 [Haladaptatus litoreus]
MAILRRWVPPSDEWKRALLLGSLASLVYTGIVLEYSVQPSSNISITASVWHALGLYSVMAFGTIGLPIVLWIRYKIRSPAVLMTFVFLFCHVLVYVPTIGSGDGDSPAFLFMFLFAPFYVVGYGLLAGGEYWLRKRDVSLPFLSA